MLSPDRINAINQAETEQRVVYTVSDGERAAPKWVYMERLNQNRRIVPKKAIRVEFDGGFDEDKGY